jgi:hypothetical protein
MHLPVDEMLVFGPIAVLAAVFGARKIYLAMKYRQVP